MVEDLKSRVIDFASLDTLAKRVVAVGTVVLVALGCATAAREWLPGQMLGVVGIEHPISVFVIGACGAALAMTLLLGGTIQAPSARRAGLIVGVAFLAALALRVARTDQPKLGFAIAIVLVGAALIYLGPVLGRHVRLAVTGLYAAAIWSFALIATPLASDEDGLNFVLFFLGISALALTPACARDSTRWGCRVRWRTGPTRIVSTVNEVMRVSFLSKTPMTFASAPGHVEDSSHGAPSTNPRSTARPKRKPKRNHRRARTLLEEGGPGQEHGLVSRLHLLGENRSAIASAVRGVPRGIGFAESLPAFGRGEAWTRLSALDRRDRGALVSLRSCFQTRLAAHDLGLHMRGRDRGGARRRIIRRWRAPEASRVKISAPAS